MKFVSTFLTLLVLYVLLSVSDYSNTQVVIQELIVGGILSFVVTLLVMKFIPIVYDVKFPIRLLAFIFLYLPVFTYALILANLDVAKRVLSPKIPLNPGFVKAPTALKGDIAKFVLANSITLTPGTLSVDIINGEIYIHTLNVLGTKEEDKTKMTALFEKVLKVVFN